MTRRWIGRTRCRRRRVELAGGRGDEKEGRGLNWCCSKSDLEPTIPDAVQFRRMIFGFLNLFGMDKSPCSQSRSLKNVFSVCLERSTVCSERTRVSSRRSPPTPLGMCRGSNRSFNLREFLRKLLRLLLDHVRSGEHEVLLLDLLEQRLVAAVDLELHLPGVGSVPTRGKTTKVLGCQP